MKNKFIIIFLIVAFTSCNSSKEITMQDLVGEYKQKNYNYYYRYIQYNFNKTMIYSSMIISLKEDSSYTLLTNQSISKGHWHIDSNNLYLRCDNLFIKKDSSSRDCKSFVDTFNIISKMNSIELEKKYNGYTCEDSTKYRLIERLKKIK
jgi:hypothetical protein